MFEWGRLGRVTDVSTAPRPVRSTSRRFAPNRSSHRSTASRSRSCPTSAGRRPAARPSPRWPRASTRGDRFQTLLGITGSGKSATIAWTIEQVQRPTLILAPNKSLAAQLAQEFREFFPDNRVEYFVSYYDYYQPEAYIPSSDTYIEKDSSINDEIDRLRHSATAGAAHPARRHRRGVGVSCIYGLGNPEEYRGNLLDLQRRRRLRPAQHPAPARRHAVRPQRHDPRPRQVPGARRHHRGAPGLRGDGAAHRDVRRHDRAASPIVDPLTGEQLRELHRAHGLPGHPLRRRRRADAAGRRSASRPSCRSGWPGSRRRASCSRPSACACAPSTTSR